MKHCYEEVEQFMTCLLISLMTMLEVEIQGRALSYLLQLETSVFKSALTGEWPSISKDFERKC